MLFSHTITLLIKLACAMKFAFIIFKYFPYGGMQRDMLRTANELVKRGHTVTIYTMSWLGEMPADLQVRVMPQKAWFNFQRYQSFIEQAFAAMQNDHPDYIFGYNRMAGLDAHFAADPCFIERAHQQRSSLYRLLPRFKWFAACEKAIFAATSKTEILAVSLSEKPHFQKWYDTQDARFHFIPPFLSPSRFVLEDKKQMRQHLRQTFGFNQDDFVFLLTGSGFAMKGLDRAIIALAAMPQTLLNKTRLVAVGQDKPNAFLKMANKLGVSQHVIISKGRPDIPKLMQGADVCVHPAYRENTGLVILEGMACGAPMLVTASCGYAPHVAEAQAGMVSETPFNQQVFNQQWLNMRTASESTRADWSNNGLAHTKTLMQANDGSAEANILINLASQKLEENFE